MNNQAYLITIIEDKLILSDYKKNQSIVPVSRVRSSLHHMLLLIIRDVCQICSGKSIATLNITSPCFLILFSLILSSALESAQPSLSLCRSEITLYRISSLFTLCR